jgi:SAM-dependent methyltransferase
VTGSSELTFYKEHPKLCDPEDFWGQVKRTVNGKPIPQEQIDMIVKAVLEGLELSINDALLDLCCGNGALTTYIFERCTGGLGVDFSEYLIDVARKHFLKRRNENFMLQDVVEFARTFPEPERFTKGLCYGSFMFLPTDSACELLRLLRSRFTSLLCLFIGNLPDKEKMTVFFSDRNYKPGIENDPGAPIGIWYTENEFIRLAAQSGWSARISRMPPSFFASHYRFDAVLIPSGQVP